MEGDLAYTTIIPAGRGLLARQIVLRHMPDSVQQFVVHTRCFDDEGKAFHVHGDYYSDMLKACTCFAERATRELLNHFRTQED